MTGGTDDKRGGASRAVMKGRKGEAGVLMEGRQGVGEAG